MENIDLKNEFIKIYNENIKREGAKALIDWLVTTDFFTAPASVKFHSCHESGLLEHSINVYKRFKKLIVAEYGETYQDRISDESIAIISLLHDLCKVNMYKQEMRNVKVEGNWTQVPYYTVEDSLPYGHGEKSVYMISGFMRLTREESMAINWHMGGFDTRVLGGSYSLSTAFYSYPVALLFHIADVQATYLDEKPF